MIIAILILAVVIIAGGVAGTIFWFASYQQRLAPVNETATGREGIPFRWAYIAAPLALLLLSAALSAYFYHLLPPQVAVRFELDGTPDHWLSREMTMVSVLLPQLFLGLLAGAIAWGTSRIGILSRQTGSTWVKPEKAVLFMGNLVALPQLIICFAMLDIFRYNSHQAHIMPMWIFLLAVVVLATVALGIFAVVTFSKARR